MSTLAVRVGSHLIALSSLLAEDEDAGKLASERGCRGDRIRTAMSNVERVLADASILEVRELGNAIIRLGLSDEEHERLEAENRKLTEIVRKAEESMGLLREKLNAAQVRLGERQEILSETKEDPPFLRGGKK